MGLLGGIIGGVGSAVGGIVGGNATRKAAQRNAKLIKEAEENAKAWYDREYNASFLDRSDAKAAINQTRELLNERYKNAEASAVVSGATDESLARQKAAANETVSDTMSNIAAQADVYKQQVRSNYENQMDQFRKEKMDVNNQRAQATAQAAQGLAGAAGSFGDILGGLGLDSVIQDGVSKLFSKKK